MSTVKIRRSGTASSTPSSLDHGELAINYADAKLFWKDATNTIKSFVFQAYASATHNHDDRYYTESEVDSLLAGKAASSHTHTFSQISDITFPSPLENNSLVVYTAGVGWGVANSIGTIGVGSQPLGGWPAGSVGASLAGKVDTSDARLSDARTPTAHKSTHATGGSDALTPADIGAAPAASPTFTGVITVSATSGSAGSYAPSLTFSGDANTGFGQVSGQSDTASVFTAGHERVRVGSTNQVSFFNNSASSLIGGNTGITIGTGSGNSVMSLYGGTSSSCVIYFADGTSSPSTFAGYINYSHSTNDMTIATNGTGRVRVKNTGALNFAPLSADPAIGEAGDVYYNSSTNKLRVYNGTSWIDLH